MHGALHALLVIPTMLDTPLDVHVQWDRDGNTLIKTVIVDGHLHRRSVAAVPECTVTFDMAVDSVGMHLFRGSPFPGSPNPAEGPDGWQAPAAAPLVVLEPLSDASPAGWSDTGTTIGNNAVQGSFFWNGVDGIVHLPQVPLDTLHEFDADAWSVDSYEAVGAHAFATINLAHDWFWRAGFREQDGAAQQSNFGRGGVEGDAVLVELMHNEGNPKYIAGCACNATDGEPPVILLWNFFNELLVPDRHSALDTGIIVHEYTHVVTTRLVGAPVNPDGSDNVQGRALSEGLSDFFALLWEADETDDPAHAHTIGAWPALHFIGNGEFFDNYWFGVRTYPYSTDLSINPRHLGHMDPRAELPPNVPASPLQIVQDHGEHEVGEIIAAFLWDYWALMRDRYTFNVARSRTAQTVILAEKLMPLLPTFADFRDALIEADQMISAGENWVPIWQAAAGRGLGAGAIVPPSDRLVPVAPSFVPIDFADWDLNGEIDVNDAIAFHADLLGPTLRADLNLDQKADVLDLIMWLGDFDQ